MRVFIADDEPTARTGLRAMLLAFSDVVVVGEAGNGALAVDGVRSLRPDLLLVDIEMPGLDGFATLRALTDTPLPAIVFVTAFEQYALAAFEANAVDYLLKPFNEARLARSLERTRRFLGSRTQGGDAVPVDYPATANAWRWRTHRLVVRDRGSLVFVEPDTVDWIQSWGNYVRLYVGGRTLLLRETLCTLAARLDPSQFVRISRTVVVNGDRVRAIAAQPNGQVQLMLKNAQTLIGSRRHRDGVLEFFDASRPPVTEPLPPITNR